MSQEGETVDTVFGELQKTFEKLTTKLKQALIQQVNFPIFVTKIKTSQLVKYLKKLNCGDDAKTALLNTKHNMIQKRIKYNFC